MFDYFDDQPEDSGGLFSNEGRTSQGYPLCPVAGCDKGVLNPSKEFCASHERLVTRIMNDAFFDSWVHSKPMFSFHQFDEWAKNHPGRIGWAEYERTHS